MEWQEGGVGYGNTLPPHCHHTATTQVSQRHERPVWATRTGAWQSASIRVMDWQVYIILCSDATLYTGITNDIDRRLSRHAGQQGARYFRGRKPLRVVYQESGHTRSSASKREARIKKLPRREKWRLIASEHNEIVVAEDSG